MDRAIDATAALEPLVGRIDDGVDLERGDVGDHDFEPRRSNLGGEQRGLHWRIISAVPRIRPPLHASGARERTAGATTAANAELALFTFTAVGATVSKSLPSARISSRRSMVLRTPISSKCASRKRRTARRPARCSISKKSKSVFSRLAGVNFLPMKPRSMRCTLMRRYSPGPVPRGSRPWSISRCTNSMARYSATSDELNVISLTRLRISLRRRRRRRARHRVDLHHQHVLALRAAEEREDRRIGGVAAVPVGHAVDFHRAKHIRQRRRGHHRVGVDRRARKDPQPPGVHVGGGDEELQRVVA